MYLWWRGSCGEIVVVSVFWFKQKTAHEILAGLVGPEMIIRDSLAIQVEHARIHVALLAIQVGPARIHVALLAIQVEPARIHVALLAIQVEPARIHVALLAIQAEPARIHVATLDTPVGADRRQVCVFYASVSAHENLAVDVVWRDTPQKTQQACTRRMTSHTHNI